MSKHTPLPWRRRGDEIAIDTGKIGGRKQIAKMIPGFGPKGLSPTSKANAEFIVRACNAYDDLLAACKSLVASAPIQVMRDDHPYAVALTMARAAIRKHEVK